MNTTVALISDTHTGHKLGLLNPESKLLDEDENGIVAERDVHLTEVQKYLWNLHQSGIDRAAAMPGQLGIIHAGDVAQGNKRPNELLSSRVSDQVLLARDVFAPWYGLKRLAWVRMTKGTGAHELEEGSASIMIAEMLKAKYPKVDTAYVFHGLLTAGGVTIDYSHHGASPGTRAWLTGNEARYYLKSLMLYDLLAGRVPPRVVIRGHYHTPVIEDVRLDGHVSTLILLPSMCMVDSYARQSSRSPSRITNGMMFLAIEDGKLLDIVEHMQTIDIRTEEVL